MISGASWKVLIVSCVVLALSSLSLGDSITITVTGQGACRGAFVGNTPVTISCTNTNTSVIGATTALGFSAGNPPISQNNWFAFDIPNLGTIITASISIFHGSGIIQNPNQTFNLDQATAINWNGLQNQNLMGLIQLSHVVAGYNGIAVTYSGVGILNGAQGSQFIFGGFSQDDPGSSIFGDIDNHPATLTLNYASAGPAPVPEPASLLLLASGLLCSAGIRRKY